MNTIIFQHSKKGLLLLLVLAGLLQVSCKKDNTAAAPSIRQLRAISPKPNDSTLSAALPGQIVVIQGANLATTTQIWFDGFAAAVNTALYSDTTLVVTVPAIAWDSVPAGKLNTVTVVTAGGSATYKFVITPPTPSITYVSNEMAQAGQTIVITGANFYGITKVTFPGNIAAASFTRNSVTQVTATVPAGITTGGTLSVTGTYGTGVSVLLFDDFTTGMLTTFDDGNFSWGCSTTNDATLCPNNNGTYSRIAVSGVGAGDFAWYDGVRSMNTNGVTWIASAHMADAVGSYALKFEMYLRKPWGGSSFYITKDYSWTYLARYEPWKTSGTGTYTTSGWTTVVIPLTTFKTKAGSLDGTGASVATLAALVGGGSGVLNFMFINSDATAAPAFDGAFDNFRIVKIQ